MLTSQKSHSRGDLPLPKAPVRNQAQAQGAPTNTATQWRLFSPFGTGGRQCRSHMPQRKDNRCVVPATLHDGKPWASVT